MSYEQLLDRLSEDFLARFRRGERPAVSEYIERGPELADEIRVLTVPGSIRRFWCVFFPAKLVVFTPGPPGAHDPPSA